MYRKKSILFVSVFLIVALSACNLPGGTPESTEEPDLALTITALASGQNPPQGNSGGDVPVAPAGPQETATPQFTATASLTPTPTVPQVTVSTNTNCRVGPGVVYDLIDSLLIGQTAEVVGKNSGVPNYWVIKRVNGTGTCWLWGEYATVSGNTANLPEYPVPPTPTPSPTPTFTPTPTPVPPAAASNLVANKACNPAGAPPGFLYAGGTISWQDNANNETGYYVYLGPSLNGTLAANVTSHPIPPLLVLVGQPITMSVEAYNSAGKSAKVDITFSCP